ncbi:MAG TPA: hypothetical protein VIM51_04045 [Desulfosporosinus sp.]
MKEEYVTVRLFKNNRTENCIITNEELHDWNLQSTDTQDNSQDNNKTVESGAKSNNSCIPQKILSVIQRVFSFSGS